LSSFAIFRALLVYLQGEAHPLYIAERRLTPSQYTNALSSRLSAGCLIFFLLIALVVANFMRSSVSFGIGLPLNGLSELTPPALILGWLFSMTWTVPLSMYAGQAISRERAAQTWDMLRTSPYTTEEILLTKAAASIRGVWSTVITISLTVTLLRMVLIGVLLVMAVQAGGLPAVLAVALTLFALILIPIEITQEIALSVVVGIAVGLGDISTRLTAFVGAVGGFLIRLVQLGVIWWLLTHLSSTISPEVIISTTSGGASRSAKKCCSASRARKSPSTAGCRCACSGRRSIRP